MLLEEMPGTGDAAAGSAGCVPEQLRTVHELTAAFIKLMIRVTLLLYRSNVRS